MTPPSFLSTNAKRQFTKLGKQLPPLTEPQQALLALYVQSWEDYHRAQDDIREHGQVIRSNDRLYVNPACNTKAEAWKQITKLAKVFGFLPKMEAGEVNEVSPLEKLLGGDDE